MRAARTAPAIAVLALGLGLAACTATPAGDQVATAAGPATTTTIAGAGAGAAGDSARGAVAWAGCMREQGIDIPDPDPNAAPGQQFGFDKGKVAARDRAAWDRAITACAPLEPADDRDRSPLTAAELAQKRQWAGCMRDHQVPVPDPDPNDPFGPNFGRLPDMPSMTVIDAALEACQDKLPARVREGN